jgi:hypothetical protein
MRHIYFCLFLLIHISAFSQVAINSSGSNPTPSSMLDVSSTSKGMLIPRMTSAERKAIQNPATGLLVFDTDRGAMLMFDGYEWRTFAMALENYSAPVIRHPLGTGTYASNFGAAVAIHGNYAVVGAPGDSANGVYCGTAYVFKKESGSWKQMARLFVPNGATYDSFGISVDIWNDYIVVGAPNHNIFGALRGKAYVFKRAGETWDMIAGLQASNGLDGDKFGASVAIDASVIVIGAPNRKVGVNPGAGTVYAFTLSHGQWGEQAFFASPNYGTNYHFGTAVDISDSMLIASSPHAKALNAAYYDIGVVYTFVLHVNNQWLQNVFFQSPFEPGDEYGSSVAISGSKIAIGSNGPTGGWTMHYRDNQGWHPTGGGLGLNELGLGYSVATDGDRYYIGCRKFNDNRGKLYIFSETFQTIYPPNPDIGSGFGFAVAAHNGNYIVGAPTSWYEQYVSFGYVD